MYKSVKAWANIPFTYKPYVSRSGTGTKTFGPSVTSVCYPSGKIEVVNNTLGKEVVSNKQLFVDGTEAIKELDNVIFEGSETEVKAIGYFYRNGVVDLKVVYL